MIALFFPVLILIALFETYLDSKKNRFMRSFFSASDDGESEDPAVRDPVVTDEDEGLEISRVSFNEIVKAFPNSFQVRPHGHEGDLCWWLVADFISCCYIVERGDDHCGNQVPGKEARGDDGASQRFGKERG